MSGLLAGALQRGRHLRASSYERKSIADAEPVKPDRKSDGNGEAADIANENMDQAGMHVRVEQNNSGTRRRNRVSDENLERMSSDKFNRWPDRRPGQ